jgi:hypothetical protein
MAPDRHRQRRERQQRQHGARVAAPKRQSQYPSRVARGATITGAPTCSGTTYTPRPIPRHIILLPTPRRIGAQVKARLNRFYTSYRLESPSSYGQPGEPTGEAGPDGQAGQHGQAGREDGHK